MVVSYFFFGISQFLFVILELLFTIGQVGFGISQFFFSIGQLFVGLVHYLIVSGGAAAFNCFCERILHAVCYFLVFIGENRGRLFQIDIDFCEVIAVPCLRSYVYKCCYFAVAQRRGSTFKVKVERRGCQTGYGIFAACQHIKSILLVSVG